ncbi:MAG: alpha/beta hydrolase [Gammaproteobacteria bacterium]|nr:alpha/beta hydrolase [Gammaproteobacteria bacterium]
MDGPQASSWRLVLWIATITAVHVGCAGPRSVALPTQDQGLIYADVYGDDERGLVLAHGGQFTKESWSEQAKVFEAAGYRVVVIDFRGRGQSRGGRHWSRGSAKNEGVHFDVLAAVRYLHRSGATTVSVVGASFGGWAAGKAAVEATPGEIANLVLLAATVDEPERLSGRTLFITTREDFRGEGDLRLPEIREQYERAPEPKQLVILEGSAHAQHIFETDQGDRLMHEILRFLSEL